MVNGYCDERFSEAKKIFQANIDSGFELGCAISLEVKGEKVIDLWGGYANTDKTELWQEETIVNVFSTTKGIAAICLFQLIEKLITGLFNLTVFDDAKFRARDGTLRMMTVIYSNKEDLDEMAYDVIRSSNLKFKNPDNLTKPHRGALWCYLDKHQCWELTEKVLDDLYFYFNKKFDKKILSFYAQRMGALYTVKE